MRRNFTMRLAGYCLLFSLVAVSISTDAAGTESVEGKGSILLKDGKIYADVPYRVIYKTMVVQIKFKTSIKNISFSDILRVSDEDGNDITKELFELDFSPDPQLDWRPSVDSSGEALPAKYWNAALSLGGNFFFPLGPYYSGFEPGPGFDAEILLPIDRKFAFRAVISYSGTKASENLAVFAGDDYGSDFLFYDYRLTSMIYLACIQWFPHPVPLESGTTLFSFHVGLGAIHHRMGATQVSVDADGTLYNPVPIKYTETKFAWRPMGMEVSCMLNSWLALQGGMGMTVVNVENSRAIQSDIKLGITLFSK